MEDIFGLSVPLLAIASIFIGLPWIILHYVTQWKKNGTLSLEDERLLDDLHDLARRLDERMGTIERIVAAEDPGFRPGLRQETQPAQGLGRASEQVVETRRDR